MLSTAAIILPIFGLIFTGYVCRKLNVLGSAASAGLSAFVIYLALPALLFDVMATATWDDLYLPGFIAAFGIGCLIVYAATLAIMLLAGCTGLPDASIEALATSYPNTGYMGFPLCMLVLGKESLPAVSIAAIITTCVLFAVAITLFEASLHRQRRFHLVIAKVGLALAGNPLLAAPLLGTAFAGTGWAIPDGVETFLRLLGGSASPCALVALGLFLAETPTSTNGWSTTMSLTAGKLVAHPAITWVLAYHVFAVPPLLAETAVLLAALPTGTGPFMLAEFYRRETAVTSKVVLLSTLVSLVTVSLLLVYSGHTALVTS